MIQNWFFWRWTLTMCKYNSVDKIYANGMEGTLSCAGKGKWMRVIGGETWRKDTAWNTDVKKGMIIKRILKYRGANAWVGVIWLNKWTNGGPLWTRQRTFGFPNMRRVAGETISFWRRTLHHGVSSYLTKAVHAAYRNKIAICSLNKRQHSDTHCVSDTPSFTNGYRQDSNS